MKNMIKKLVNACGRDCPTRVFSCGRECPTRVNKDGSLLFSRDGDHRVHGATIASFLFLSLTLALALPAAADTLASYCAKLTPHDGTARPTSGNFTYYTSNNSSSWAVQGTYKGVMIVEDGVTNYYYETLQMAIEAAKAGPVNDGYCSDANPNGCFKEGTPYDYANNDSLNPNLGRYTDVVTLCQNANVIYNRANNNKYATDATFASAPYGVHKGIVIDLNGHTATGLSAGKVNADEMLVIRNGTISTSSDAFDDEAGTGYLTGKVVFSDIDMTGKVWASNHAFYFLNGHYNITLGPNENPSLLQLRGGYYTNDPRGYKIDYADCHVELASKDPTISPYFCRVVKGATTYTVTFMNKATSSDETLGGQPFYNTPTNVVYIYGGSVAQTPAVTKPGAKLVGWTTSSTGTVPEYTNDELSTITSEHDANVFLYSVYGVEVGVPAFVALDELSALPTDGREYTFVITNLDSFTTMPANRFATIPVPTARGEANCVGFGPDDPDNPWRMTYTKGDYYYHVSQVTNGVHAGEKLDEGRWEIQLEVDPDATPRYSIKSAVYSGKVADLDENSFHIVKKDNNVAAAVTVEGSKTKVALGGNKVVKGDGFNTAVMKGKFEVNFARNFRVVGSFTPPKEAVPDGTCVGFMPNPVTLAPSDLVYGGGLGYITNPKFAKSLVLDFDPFDNGSTYGDPGYSHFTLTETMDNGYPNFSTAQHKKVTGTSWPTSPSQYLIENDAVANKLTFKVTLPNGTILDYAYNNPTNLFKSKTAYFFMSGVVRYGAAGSWGLGSVGSTAPSLTMYFDSFNYLGQREGYGSVTNIFVNRQEACVKHNALGGHFADGEETWNLYAEDAVTTFPPVDPTRTGYDFNGWYVSWTNGAAQVVHGVKMDPIVDHTVYAQWISKVTPQGEGAKTFDYETTGDGSGALLKGATNKLVTTDLAIPEFVSNGTGGSLPYVIIEKDAFSYANYDQKRERELQKAGVPEAKSVTNDLTSVTVSTFVTNIQSYAFYGCAQLTNVTFSKTRDYKTGEKATLHIRDWAFQDSGVRSVAFPADSKVVLDYGCFAGAEYLRDITFLGDVELKAKYPFVGSGTRIFNADGSRAKVTLHLSAKLASDARFVAALTNGMSNVRVELSDDIVGTITTKTMTPGQASVSFVFTVETDSPWLKVTKDTLYCFWATTPDGATVGTGNVKKPVTLTGPNASGEYTATFDMTDAPAACFFKLAIGDQW